MDYKLVAYQEKYFKKLYEIKKDNFKWYVEKIYGWDEEKQIEFQKKFIEEHSKNIQVIKVKDEVIGMISSYIDENNENIVELIYIDKKYQGKGIGTNLLKEQLKRDKENKRNTILQVFKENSAKHLYEKLGFKTYEETDTHYKMRKKYEIDEVI